MTVMTPVPEGQRARQAPANATLVSDELVLYSEPGGRRAEAIRTLRTHIMAQHVDAGRRALAVCGARTGVGCSFVAVNLAAALAQIGVRTLLIDGDLRAPGIDRLIPSPNAADGLKQCLEANDSNFGAHIQRDVLPDLALMYAGGAAEHAQELLASERFEEVIKFCLREFDVTIVDTPPANTCSDARRISNVLGYSLVVARKNRSLFSDVRLLTQELKIDHARVVGAVLDER
jgi:capsular exopolysaccharide synthesis family protein